MMMEKVDIRSLTSAASCGVDTSKGDTPLDGVLVSTKRPTRTATCVSRSWIERSRTHLIERCASIDVYSPSSPNAGSAKARESER
jgi:hypothetical protein